MTNPTSLADQIEHLVREHMVQTQQEILEALSRAFGSKKPVRTNESATVSRKGRGVKRDAQELAALEERFYETVCARPGETMTVLAAHLNMSPRTLKQGMVRCKRAGRVRSVGQRQSTKYFPLP